MRRWRSLVAGALTAALVVVPVGAGPVAAADPDDPVIESPVPGATHYRGYTGPFVVNLENAPFGSYAYRVERVPAGGGTPVLVWASSDPYDWNGTFPRPQLRVTPLAPGSGYVFRVRDTSTGEHTASLPFAVSSATPPRCSIVLPAAVRMAAPSYLVRATLSAQCKTLRTTYAAWEARHPVGGFAQTFVFDGVRNDTWRIYDDERTGTYTVRPNAARSSTNEAVLQNVTRLVLRMDARLRLTAQRAGGYVTLRASESRYSPRANRFQAWSGRKVVLSSRACGTCAWKRVAVRTTDRNGAVGFRVRAPQARQYRVTATGTTTTWAPRSVSVRR